MTIDVFNDNGTVLVQIKDAPSGTDKRIADALCDGVVRGLQEFLIPQPDDSAERLDSIKEKVKTCEAARAQKQVAPVKEDETVEDEPTKDEIPVDDAFDDGEFDDGAFSEEPAEDAAAAEGEPTEGEISAEDESAEDESAEDDEEDDEDFFDDCFA